MKPILTILFFVVLTGGAVQCHKKGSCRNAVVHQYSTCNTFGLQFDGDPFLYQTYSLPVQYQHEGASICITYTIFDDMRMCPAPCCGGKIVNILSIN